MRKKFKLRCDYSNDRRTGFTMFDQSGSVCGMVTILTSGVLDFLQNDWNGDIDWCGHLPKELSK